MKQDLLRQADLDQFTPKGQCLGGLGGYVLRSRAASLTKMVSSWLKVSVSSSVNEDNKK